jgi:hypothetical protein
MAAQYSFPGFFFLEMISRGLSFRSRFEVLIKLMSDQIQDWYLC